MAVKIRLLRCGKKKKPFYRIVAATAQSPRDGKFLELLGHYNPFIDFEKDTKGIDELSVDMFFTAFEIIRTKFLAHII